MTFGKLLVGGDFIDFTHWGAWDGLGEEKLDQAVTLLRRGPLADHGVELVDYPKATLMVSVVRMVNEFLPCHKTRELMPVVFGKAVNPDLAVGTWIGIAGAAGGMTV